MGLEAAILPAIIGFGTFAAVSGAFSGGAPKPQVGSSPVARSEGSINDDAEKRRRQVVEQLAKFRQQTLLAHTNQPEPLLGKTSLLGVK